MSCQTVHLRSEQGCQMSYFHTKKIPFGFIVEGLGMDTVGIVYGQKEYFKPFDILYGHLVYFVAFCIFFPILVCCTKNNLASQVANRSFDPHRTFSPCLPFRSSVSFVKIIFQQLISLQGSISFP
jgi:hypothetical protein